ncbi:MAG: (d)CMP kinase [Pseudomonadota bacterium]
MTFIVAIDGPAASGKGTISQAVAEEFGFAHLDTGILYRIVGREALADLGPALDSDADITAIAQNISVEDLARTDLRTAAVAEAASRVAVIPGVRTALVEFQREFAKRPSGVVMDGRDIGTVICPDADVKLYVTASAEARAKRRTAELIGRGEDTQFETVLKDVEERDARDAERATAPMRPAEDAVTLDTSALSIDQAIAAAVEDIIKVYNSDT